MSKELKVSKPTKLIMYTDPGHGWLRVPHRMLKKLGISSLITPFSYTRTEYAYLEEDVDMTTFILAMEAAGKKFTLRERNTNRQSRIRNYRSYIDQSPVVVPVAETETV